MANGGNFGHFTGYFVSPAGGPLCIRSLNLLASVMRGVGSHTRQDHVRHARRFAAFLNQPPDTATPEQANQGQTRDPKLGR